MSEENQAVEIGWGQLAERGKSAKRTATVVYILQAVAFFLGGLTFFIGLVVNYVKRSEARDTWLDSHFRWQIRTFWFGFLWALLGIPISFITLGLASYFIYLAILFWLIYRVAKGWLRLTDGKEMYTG